MKKGISWVMKNARKNKNMKQGELAKKLGYSSAQFISNWERGVCNPPMAKLKKIVRVLEIEPSIIRNALVVDYTSQVNKELGLRQ